MLGNVKRNYSYSLKVQNSIFIVVLLWYYCDIYCGIFVVPALSLVPVGPSSLWPFFPVNCVFLSRWYRAKIFSIRPEREYDVFYVDYGDREWVTEDRVRPAWTDILQVRRLTTYFKHILWLVTGQSSATIGDLSAHNNHLQVSFH